MSDITQEALAEAYARDLRRLAGDSTTPLALTAHNAADSIDEIVAACREARRELNIKQIALDEAFARIERAERACAQMRAAVEAARAFEADLSPDCDGPLRDALRAALARA